MMTLNRQTEISFDTDTAGKADPIFIESPCVMLI
jgi:hypothetical protein